MQPHFIPIIILLIIILSLYRRRKLIAVKKVIERNGVKEKEKLIELAKKFIDKECLIYSFDGGHQYEGIIKEVADGAILLEKDGNVEVINLSFVIRIREFPKNKKGKKKSVVLD